MSIELATDEIVSEANQTHKDFSVFEYLNFLRREATTARRMLEDDVSKKDWADAMMHEEQAWTYEWIIKDLENYVLTGKHL